MDMFIGHLDNSFLAGLPHLTQVRNGLEFHAGHSAYHTTEAWPYKLLLETGAIKVSQEHNLGQQGLTIHIYISYVSFGLFPSPDHRRQHCQHSLEPFVFILGSQTKGKG